MSALQGGMEGLQHDGAARSGAVVVDISSHEIHDSCMSDAATITAQPFGGFVKRIRVPATEFPRVLERQKENIESVIIVPAELGKRDDFGSVEIWFSVPVNDPQLCPAT